MNEAQFMDALRILARHIVRNELVCEYFFESLGVSRENLWTKAREMDQHLKEHTDWQKRFPGLFD